MSPVDGPPIVAVMATIDNSSNLSPPIDITTPPTISTATPTCQKSSNTPPSHRTTESTSPQALRQSEKQQAATPSNNTIDNLSTTVTPASSLSPTDTNTDQNSTLRRPGPSTVQPSTTPQTRIPQNRPGRIPFRKSQTIDIERSYGSRVTDRSPSCIRVFFQNTKGLSYSATGEDYNYYMTCTKALGADIIGMAETNTAWQHPHLRFHFTACARRHYPLMKAAFSSPTKEVDPIPEKETFQSGGTTMLTTADLVPMVFGANDNDPTGLGRWSSQTVRGKNQKMFTAITGYRVSKGTISAKRVGSAFSREYEHHRTCNIKSPQPRKIFLNDLKTYILKLQSLGHSILLMMDSNGQLHDDNDLKNFTIQCDLHDLHKSDPSPTTYIGTEDHRIDHILGCAQTLAALDASGSLSFLEGPQSDHRGLYVDLDTKTLLEQEVIPLQIEVAAKRALKSGNPELVELYNTTMLQ